MYKMKAGIIIGIIAALAIVALFDQKQINDFVSSFEISPSTVHISEEEYIAQFDYFVAKYVKSYKSNEAYQYRFQVCFDYKFIVFGLNFNL